LPDALPPTAAPRTFPAELLREPLAHSFRAVARDDVRDLVPHDDREAVAVLGDWQYARIDSHLAARQREGVDLLRVVDDRELPFVVGRLAACASRSPIRRTGWTTRASLVVGLFARTSRYACEPSFVSSSAETRMSCDRW
jgi:hypothetical protein